jgi:hypothetical protein
MANGVDLPFGQFIPFVKRMCRLSAPCSQHEINHASFEIDPFRGAAMRQTSSWCDSRSSQSANMTVLVLTIKLSRLFVRGIREWLHHPSIAFEPTNLQSKCPSSHLNGIRSCQGVTNRLQGEGELTMNSKHDWRNKISICLVNMHSGHRRSVAICGLDAAQLAIAQQFR